MVAYDIADDRRRRQLASCLGRRLGRVQESVFEGWLSQSEAVSLMREAESLLDVSLDRLRAYPLAVRKSDRYQCYGQQSETLAHQDFWVIG